MRRMRGTERDGQGLLPLPLPAGSAASSSLHLSKNSTEIPDNTRGGEENVRATPPPSPKQEMTPATVEAGVSESPDRDENSRGEGEIIGGQEESDGDAQVWKEARQGSALEELVEPYGGSGLNISGNSSGNGGAAGVAAVAPGAPAVETSGGMETRQRPEVAHGTSGEGIGGGVAEQRQTYGKGCDGCVVG